MRALATCIIALGLMASPALAAGGAKNGATPSEPKATAADRAANPAAQPANNTAANAASPAEPAAAEMESELQQLRDAIATQAQQIQDQQKKMQQLEEELKASGAARENLSAAPAAPAAPAAAASTAATAPLSTGAVSAASPVPSSGAAQDQNAGESPLQFKIGRAYITPVGFMDFTGVVRSTNGGSGIGTNFAGIPYGGASSYQTQESEFRMSMQNSRIGFRIDADVDGGHALAYWESDFLGAAPSNVAVSSNSNTFRSRLFWFDYRKGAWEFLGGQTWSLATANRVGVSPLPGDVFYTDDFDTNYQLGMVWGRIPEFRVAYHFTDDKAAFAVAIDSPDQYMGGTNGSTTITLPAAFNNSTYINGELDAGGGTLGPPNRGPDVIAKFVVDPSKRFHGEIGGIARFFQLYNQTTHTQFSSTGGAGFVNLNAGVIGGLRAVTNNYWGDGGGRYIFGQAPDLVVRADGSPVLVHSGSTLDGLEYTRGNKTFAVYYGLAYISRNVLLDTNGCNIGWGYYPSAGSLTGCTTPPSGQNRNIQEGSLNYIHTFWKNPRYGALTLFLQYSYLTRNPWYVAPGAPHSANASMGWFNLRYTLPGSAPTLGKF